MENEPKERRRELRANSTNAENLLWGALRGRKLLGLKFRRQRPIGPFFADFVCLETRIVIELDGDYHEYVEHRDDERQKYLEQEGYHVMRFENDEVIADVGAVLIAIERGIGRNPSP